jgi:cell division protein ZapA
VERVDTAMCKIRDAGKVKARDRIAVLAALNLAFDLGDRPEPALPVVRPVAAPLPEGEPQPALEALIARLDRALGSDGQLL